MAAFQNQSNPPSDCRRPLSLHQPPVVSHQSPVVSQHQSPAYLAPGLIRHLGSVSPAARAFHQQLLPPPTTACHTASQPPVVKQRAASDQQRQFQLQPSGFAFHYSTPGYGPGAATPPVSTTHASPRPLLAPRPPHAPPPPAPLHAHPHTHPRAQPHARPPLHAMQSVAGTTEGMSSFFSGETPIGSVSARREPSTTGTAAQADDDDELNINPPTPCQ